jgi:peptidylprolyl isomerase
MTPAKKGDTVKVHYVGKLDDGSIFDSSENRQPLEFVVGSNQVIPGLEEAVIGMDPGDKKTIKIPSEQAYGPHYPELVAQFERNQFPADFELAIGLQLEIPQKDGRALLVTVTELTDESVTLDANHPLAGKDLTFEIELLEAV